ncbi:MAG: hypothetical protein CMM84_13080 [Rhodothermaceae bacterium]|nr:hypothetical protein [Rhodothermaceae bacterium]MBC14209.1 hypothetical protein [Rhodothermaceae bacterium]
MIGIGAGVVPADPASVHAPGWVLAVCGAVFVLAGVAMLAHRWPAVQSAAGGVICLAFGLVGGWVALFGEAAQFSGGTGLLSRGAEVAVARGVFGVGAVLCLAMFVWSTVLLARGRPPAERRGSARSPRR